MEEVYDNLKERIKLIASLVTKKTENKTTKIFYNEDSDSLSCAVILLKTLIKLDRTCSIHPLEKNEKEFIYTLKKDEPLIILGAGKNLINHIKNYGIEFALIIDNKNISQEEIPTNIEFVGTENKKISISGIGYLISKEINSENTEFAKIATIGMSKKNLVEQIQNLGIELENNSEIKIKESLKISPVTRPINRTLEFCVDPYIPEITGNIKGIIELLTKTKLTPTNGNYKAIIDLTREELTNLTEKINEKMPQLNQEDIFGKICLIKFFDSFEDSLEITNKIDSCFKVKKRGLAPRFCLEKNNVKKEVESNYATYKQALITGIKVIREGEKEIIKNLHVIRIAEIINKIHFRKVMKIISGSGIFKENQTLMILGPEKIFVKNLENSEYIYQIFERKANEVEAKIVREDYLEISLNKEREKEFVDSIKKSFEIELVKI